MTLPTISCIMPTYGRPNYVGEAVQMFLNQDYPAERCELVILNDCSGQRFRIAPELAHRVRVVNREERYGSLGEKRNAAIAIASGDLIAVWDDDDLYMPWRLSFSVDQMHANDTRFYRASSFWAYWGGTQLHHNRANRNWISHSLCLFDKKLWEEVGGYPKMNVREDAVFFERVHETLTGNTDDWIVYPTSPSNRYYIMRGLSEYQHMSINGGAKNLDTSPGDFDISPADVADPVLRDVFERLVAGRQHYSDDHSLLDSSLMAEADAKNRPSYTDPRQEAVNACNACQHCRSISESHLACDAAGGIKVPWTKASCRLRKWKIGQPAGKGNSGSGFR